MDSGKLGIIQLRGAGDCLIALPIAKYFYDKGYEIYWVIDAKFQKAFQYAAPYVNFLPLAVEEKTIQSNIRNPYWFETPRQMLLDVGCNEVVSFPYEEILHFKKIGMPSRLIDPVPIRAKELGLSFHTTFDQFKYAATSVPFEQKWKLDIRRNLKQEKELYNRLVWDRAGPYILAHTSGAMGRIKYDLDLRSFAINIGLGEAQIIEVSDLTDNIFDWTTLIEKSACFVGIDSFFVNLVEQLQMKIRKFFIRRSPTNFTPVLKESWDYLPIQLATDEPHDLQF